MNRNRSLVEQMGERRRGRAKRRHDRRVAERRRLRTASFLFGVQPKNERELRKVAQYSCRCWLCAPESSKSHADQIRLDSMDEQENRLSEGEGLGHDDFDDYYAPST